MSAPKGGETDGSFGSDMVRIVAGPTKQHFEAPRRFLIANSEYFAQILDTKNAFQSLIKVIELPDYDSLLVHVFIRWLYRGEIPPLRKRNSGRRDSDVGHDDATALLKLYMMADRMLFKSLQNEITDKLLDWFSSFGIRGSHINLVYKNTTPGSKLRKLVSDVATYSIYCGALMGRDDERSQGRGCNDTEDINEQLRIIGDFAIDMLSKIQEVIREGKLIMSETKCWEQNEEQYHV